MRELQVLLDSACSGQAANALTLQQVKDWLAEYLDAWREECERFPSEQQRKHWDLVAADFDESDQATFLAALFNEDRVAFMAGRAPVHAIRSFEPDGADRIFETLSAQFETGNRWDTDAKSIAKWVASEDS